MVNFVHHVRGSAGFIYGVQIYGTISTLRYSLPWLSFFSVTTLMLLVPLLTSGVSTETKWVGQDR